MKIEEANLRKLIRDELTEVGRLNPEYAPDQPDQYYSIGDWAVENLLYNDAYAEHRDRIRSSRSQADARAYLDDLMKDPATKALIEPWDLPTRRGKVPPGLMVRAAVHGPDLGYGEVSADTSLPSPRPEEEQIRESDALDPQVLDSQEDFLNTEISGWGDQENKMKITHKHLRQLIREELDFSLAEAQPGPAKPTPRSAKEDILDWMSSTRSGMLHGSKYKNIKGPQKLTFILKKDGKISIDVSTEWENTKENEDRRRKAGAAPVTYGHFQSLGRAVGRAMRGETPDTYTMSYSL